MQAADIVQTAEQVGRFIVGLLTMGQILSIPMILLGLYLIVRAYLNAAPVTSRHGRKLQRG